MQLKSGRENMVGKPENKKCQLEKRRIQGDYSRCDKCFILTGSGIRKMSIVFAVKSVINSTPEDCYQNVEETASLKESTVSKFCR